VRLLSLHYFLLTMFVYKALVLLILSLATAFFPFASAAQIRLSDWQTYSALSDVRAVAQAQNGLLWGATSGGVFTYNPLTQTTQEFRNIDALVGLNVTALRIQSTSGVVFSGSADGMLNVYDGQRWFQVTDIFTAARPQKRINDFAFRDSLVFIAGEFGLVVFNARRNVFAETVVRIGSLPANTPVQRLLVSSGRLWVGTASGVASAPISAPSFSNPAVWTTHPLAGTQESQAISALAEFQGSVVAASGRLIWRTASGSATMALFRSGLAGNIKGLATFSDTLYCALENSGRAELVPVSSTTASVASMPTSLVYDLTSLPASGSAQAQLALCTADGLALWSPRSFMTLAINSPSSNRFRQIAIDQRGTVWCVNGSGDGNANVNNNGAASGIYRLLGGVWRNLRVSTEPALGTDAFYQVYAAADSSIWASSWGGGVVRLRVVDSSRTAPSGVEITRFTQRNSTLFGLNGSDGPGSFIVAGAVRIDARTGTAWIPNFTSDTIYARDRQGRFYAFGRPAALRTCPYINNLLLTIDPSGTKWIASGSTTTLWAMNERGTLDNLSDDQWQCVSGAFTGTAVTCLTSDSNGEIWIGTRQGLYRIVNGFDVFSTDRRLITSSVRESQLGRIAINDIFVDAQNNKWLATNSGVWVLSPDGGEVLSQFSTATTPLVSNNVLSVAIDNNTGRAYFGTDNGLSSAQTLAVRPNADFSSLRCYPQPFVPSEDLELVIDGLAENSQVNITTLDGTLVRRLSANNSRTVLWDGLDSQNRSVSSGVYIISAFSSSGGGINGVAKAVVLQRR
jgi:ligand-binding sensor domain-containing protein